MIEEFDINDLQEAIVGQIEKNGVNYQAQVISQATVDAIVADSEEQCR